MKRHVRRCLDRSTRRSTTWIAMLVAPFLVGIGSLCQAHADESLPVRVELFEEMGAKPKATSKPSGSAATSSDAVGPVDDAGFNDTEAYGGYEGVRAVPHGQTPDRVYRATAFGFHRLPFKYDETGVRLLPKGPIVFRASATLALEKGQYQIIIRTREDAKLTVDGEVIANVQVEQLPSDGHNPVRPVPRLVAPTVKDFSPGNTEHVVAFTSDGSPHAFVLETVVGRAGRRPDLGVLAVAIAGEVDDSFRLLGAEQDIAFSDQGWEDYIAREDAYSNMAQRSIACTPVARRVARWPTRRSARSSPMSAVQPPRECLPTF